MPQFPGKQPSNLLYHIPCYISTAHKGSHRNGLCAALWELTPSQWPQQRVVFDNPGSSLLPIPIPATLTLRKSTEHLSSTHMRVLGQNSQDDEPWCYTKEHPMVHHCNLGYPSISCSSSNNWSFNNRCRQDDRMPRAGWPGFCTGTLQEGKESQMPLLLLLEGLQCSPLCNFWMRVRRISILEVIAIWLLNMWLTTEV